MAKEVVLTLIAEQDLERITNYLVENWGNLVCEKFLDRFESTCENISISPRTYRLVYKKLKIRKCILTK